MIKMLKFFLLIFLFIIILNIFKKYYYTPVPYNSTAEGFTSGKCPTTMIKRGDQILLYNPNYVKVPGVNPVVLKSLKEYEDYVKWQRANKLDCPILHLESMYNTQGLEQYEIKSSFKSSTPTGPLNHELPHIYKTPDLNTMLQDNDNHNDKYNKNFHSPYDPYNQEIGVYTSKDLIKLDKSNFLKYKKDCELKKFNTTLY